MKLCCLILSVLSFNCFVFSQNELDIYRYSNTFNEGSARFEAMGGAFGALGAESGVARINPAGFGRFSSSSFGFSLSGISTNNTSTFQSTSTQKSDYSTRIPNASIVLVNDISSNRKGFLYFQFGFGLNRITNFNNSFTYSGEQFESLLDIFSSQAQGVDPVDLYSTFPFSTSLAYETYAIDYDGTNYAPRLTLGNQMHKRTVTTLGGITEYFFNFSGNYLNKIYVGGNIGIQSLRYNETVEHHESLLDTTGVSLRSFDYMYQFTTKGTGFNLKLGAIFLPTEQIRLGIAIHTPTAFNLKDSTVANMTALHSDGLKTVPSELVPFSVYKYRLSTPPRVIFSFANTFLNKGCISLDVEWINYQLGKLKTTLDDAYETYHFTEENKVADTRFKSVFNIRLGGEWVFSNRYFIRAGYGYFQKGDSELINFGKKFDQQISAGLGYRINGLSIDLAIRQLQQTKTYQAFSGSNANVSFKSTGFIATVAYKFL